MIYFTSDLHFGHDKTFLYQPRGFSSIQEHDESIIKKWNSIITPEDEVYILGDLMLNNNDHGLECLMRLNGIKKIIRGNHDTNARIELYNNKKNINIFFLGEAFTLKYKGYIFYLSHFPTICSNFDDGKYLKQRIINLCGHSHTQDVFIDWDKYHSAIYHCELDAHNCFPVSIEDVINHMYTKFINN